MRTPLVRSAAVAAVCGALLAAPGAAVADDAAMKAAIPAAFDALAAKERAASRAIQSFNRRDRATRAGRAKVRAVGRAVRTFQALLLGQEPSTPQGEEARRALLRGLDLEATATRRIDLAMKSAGRSSVARTNRIIARANRTLKRANAALLAAMRLVQAL
ncbi:MAG: hypothetical protein IRZ32_14635 [Solirubrobacteraceae bacterium]|nr:hypothetical protein [Solirubrobacteraceae bacterium]